jgi:probable biosynthetic protein (TIGR04098 family)
MTDGPASFAALSAPVHKQRLSRQERLLRLILGVIDPRAWAHMLKVVNQYNYSHVAPLRAFRYGPGAEISPNAILSNSQNITAGARLHLGAHSALWAGPSARGRIVLGDDVSLGPRAFVTAANYRFNDGAPVRSSAMSEAEIIVGNDVWIGAAAIILAGSHIGEGAIVGAGAVVRGEVAPYAIVSGNPAVLVGYRTRPGAEAEKSSGGEPYPAVLQLIRTETGLQDEALRLPVDVCGIDSFGLMTLRTFLEEKRGGSIPDAQWAGIATLEDIARLPALQKGIAATLPPRRAGTDVPTRPSNHSSALQDEVLPAASILAPGRSLRRQTINMPQMALTGLGEAWLFKELGDIHWAMITHFLKTTSAAIADDQGDRLYATFTRILMVVEPSLRGFRENDRLEIDSTLERHGAGFFFGRHMLEGGSGRGETRTMSTFAKYGERGKNTSLMKGTPTLPDPDAIPSLAELPEFGLEYRARRAQEREENLFECNYEILPPHDINGVGLLYFAAYPSAFDLCFERSEGKGFLLTHSTVSKDVFYFANSEPTETLRFRLHSRDEENGLIRHTASLYRRSDGKRMAEVSSAKRRMN